MIIAWRAEWPVLISPSAIVLGCGFAALVGNRIWILSRISRLAARSDGGAAVRVDERRRAHVENEWAALQPPIAQACESLGQVSLPIAAYGPDC